MSRRRFSAFADAPGRCGVSPSDNALGDQLDDTSRLAAGLRIGLSTEFIGESRTALKKVLKEASDVLNQDEITEIEQILRQLTASINKWPVQPPG
jgi:hypothetical protein